MESKESYVIQDITALLVQLPWSNALQDLMNQDMETLIQAAKIVQKVGSAQSDLSNPQFVQFLVTVLQNLPLQQFVQTEHTTM